MLIDCLKFSEPKFNFHTMHNAEFESLKKAAELNKLNKEITKIEAETKEICWRKLSAWAPAISSIIIGMITLYFTISSGFLDGKSALVKAETLVLQVRKDSLSRTIDSLNKKSSVFISTIDKQNLEIKTNNKQLDSLELKFIQDKIKFDKERGKYRYVICQKEKEIGGLKNENIGLEECLPKAKDFLKYCIRYEEYEPELYNQESLIKGYKPPYKTRFSLSLEEVANLNISSMTYQQFLIEFAGFKVEGQLGTGVSDYLYSLDKKVSVIVRSNGGNFQRTATNNINENRSQFECYKSLSKEQRLNLLKHMIIRK